MDEIDYPQRRSDDRAALSLVYTLTERVSTIIHRFDEYAKKQEVTQDKIKAKLETHEEMVIKAINSWRWFATIVSVLSSVVAGLAVWGFTSFTELRDSVMLHHIQSAAFIKNQEEINNTTEHQIKMLRGGNRDER